MKITISQLRVLEALARTGSFSRAAEELGISQPSVSTQLRAIENRSKSKLLARDGRTLTATRFAGVLLPKIRALLSIAEDIERTFEEERKLKAGVLRLGYSTHQFAMPVISRFMAAFPGIKVEARSMASLDLIDRLKAGLIDIVFVTAQQPPQGLHCHKLRTDQIVLMVRADHPLAKKRVVTWEQVARYPLIRREETSGTRIAFDLAADRPAVSLRTILDVGSWESMRAAVTSGIGIGVALLGEIEDDDRNVTVRIDDDRLWASHFVACMPEMVEVAAIEAMLALAGGNREVDDAKL
ncbi:MAG: LysR family transcriptional regulator [Geminicoccaceae bacterium]